MRSLARELEEWTGTKLTDERLRRAIEVHDEIDVYRAALLDGRARLPLSDSALYALLRRGEWLWPGEHLLELRAAVGRIESGPVQRGVPVLVTGYVPEPPGLLETLEGAGAFVGADDYAAIGRRISRRDSERSADPWADLVARYLSQPPCPTRGTDQETRMRHLATLAERGGARGVLVHVQKFCEPELFDVPAIRGPSRRGAFPSSSSRASSSGRSPARPRPGSRLSSSCSPRREGPPDAPPRPIRAGRARPRALPPPPAKSGRSNGPGEAAAPRRGPFGPPLEVDPQAQGADEPPLPAGALRRRRGPGRLGDERLPRRGPPAARLLRGLPGEPRGALRRDADRPRALRRSGEGGLLARPVQLRAHRPRLPC